MHRRKFQQIKAYSKIIKYKKATGQIQEMKTKEGQYFQEQQNNQQEIVEQQIQKLQFQDPIQDEYQQQQGWVSESEEQNSENEGTMISENKKNKKQYIQEQTGKKQIFMGNNKQLNKGQVLQFDNNAYDMLHRLNVQWPSMSIDFIARPSPFSPIQPFKTMNKYPYQVYTIQGSCSQSQKNTIYFTKWSNLCQTKYDDDPDAQSQQPQIIIQQIETPYDVNRLKTLNNSSIVAFWNDNGVNGQVRIMDVNQQYQKLIRGVGSKRKQKNNRQIVLPFQTTGFGLAWNPQKIGQLLVGDNNGKVTLLQSNSTYSQWTKSAQYKYHQGSVEDIIYSPQQQNIFATCSSDGTLQLIDTRAKSYKKSQLKIKAHKSDVNVCDWNQRARHLIVTGSDDCQVKIWDLRMLTDGSSDDLLSFNWHSQPITSVKFQPNEQSVIAVASEDNRLTIWDMSMQNEQNDTEVPNELMFLHQGQQQIKQICYHPVYFEMLISTSIDSINVFKPSFQMPEFDQDQKIDKQDLKRPPVRQQDLDKYIERMSLQ